MYQALIDVMAVNNIEVVIVPDGEGKDIISELTHTENAHGAIIVKNGLVTDALKFNSVHIEVLENFTILYH
jgi:hypothetical protein